MAKFTHKLLMAGLAGVTLAIAATQAAPARADQSVTTLYSQVGAWQIRVDSTLANACYMAATYHSNTEVVRFGYNNLNHSAYMSVSDPAWTSLVNGSQYQLGLQIDGGQVTTFKAVASVEVGSAPSVVMWFSDPESFMSAFGLTRQVALFYQGRELTRLNLVGTAGALSAVDECTRAYTGTDFAAKRDPFRQTGPAQPAAPARQVDPFKT
jgi:hypothetical protein